MPIRQTAVAADRRLEAVPERSVQMTRTRWWMLTFFSLLHLICFLDRGVISVAQPEIREAFGLTLGQMGVVLAAFTWTYALGQIPVGWLGDRYGPKRVLAVLIAATSAAACLTGAATGFPSLLAARLSLGLAEAGAFPVAGRGTQAWFPPSERGRAQAIVHFSGLLAVAITPLTAGAVLVTYGWRVMFFAFGAIGFLWVAAFWWAYRDRPEDHPLVSRAELATIRGVNADDSITPREPTRGRTPWRAILTSPNTWYLALGYGCLSYGFSFYLTWYPTYLRDYRGLSIAAVGLIGSIPLFAGMVGVVTGGWLTDRLLETTGSATRARRLVAVPGLLLAGVFLIPAALTADATASILYLAASFFFLVWVVGPAWAVAMDVGRSFTGTVAGVMNTSASLAASVTPIVYGTLFGRGSWVAPFVVSAAVLAAGALVWLFLIDPEKSVVGRT
jgi:sugar phosphate permease